MIRIRRLPEPAVLVEKAEGWKERFLERREASPKVRPSSGQYDHADVKDALRAMSHGKCFYCERKLSEDEETVDHFVEIVEDPTLAFTWTNLYLCCDHCQGKRTSIPRDSALDPCGDDDEDDPADHLTFENDVIRPKDGSPIGRATIQRYKLDALWVTYRRAKQLQRLKHLVIGL